MSVNVYKSIMIIQHSNVDDLGKDEAEKESWQCLSQTLHEQTETKLISETDEEKAEVLQCFASAPFQHNELGALNPASQLQYL